MIHNHPTRTPDGQKVEIIGCPGCIEEEFARHMTGVVKVAGKIALSDTWEGRFIYAGGAVDYGDRLRTHGWRHRLAGMSDLAVYCPICANADEPGIELIMRRNELALIRAEKAVFLLDGIFTVGTPIEIDWRVRRCYPETTCIVHTAPGKPGLFVQTWAKMGVAVLSSLDEVPAWLTK